MQPDKCQAVPGVRSPDQTPEMTREEMESRRLEACEYLKAHIDERGAAAEAARRFGVTRTSASRWVEAIRRGKDLHLRKASGRPSSLTPEQLRSLPDLYRQGSRVVGELYWTPEAFALAIERKLGVALHPDHVRRLMIRWIPAFRT